jgi:hypothetical protein
MRETSRLMRSYRRGSNSRMSTRACSTRRRIVWQSDSTVPIQSPSMVRPVDEPSSSRSTNDGRSAGRVTMWCERPNGRRLSCGAELKDSQTEAYHHGARGCNGTHWARAPTASSAC